MFKIACLALIVAVSAAPAWHELAGSGYTFDHFVAEFGRTYNNETEEYWTRRELFESNVQEILKFNQNPSKTWKLALNQFADATPAEFRKMLGYNKHHGFSSVAARANAIPTAKPNATYPDSVDYRKTGALTPVKNQGGCGSCWTFATAEVVESHYFIKYGTLPTLSEQQIASCTSNPKHCGGTGGCEGGTSEVAFESIIAMGGLESEKAYPYKSGTGRDYECKFQKSGVVAQLSGYKQTDINSYDSLMEAIQLGPVSISVDASAWSFYGGGIFDGCNQTNPDVDHAVLLVGYGTEDGTDYWIVRNSWGPSWGEDGFIRLKRSSEKICGTDTTPKDGSGCDGGPATVEVCGTCGILFDNSYPIIA